MTVSVFYSESFLTTVFFLKLKTLQNISFIYIHSLRLFSKLIYSNQKTNSNNLLERIARYTFQQNTSGNRWLTDKIY